ncbi:MAG: universal stress protein [Pseudomonadota bacterium]
MNAPPGLKENDPLPLPGYASILLAVDSSDHANRGVVEATTLAGLWDAGVTATHVYAAKMHDVRFRQMEGGLPEQFREEEELERQRDVHDDLITRGLSIITDSYLDRAETACTAAGITFNRCSLEGKNYRALTEETNKGDYDLLVMGALGLGAIEGSRVGTVCQRVVRRTNIDTLVIKDPQWRLQEGPIVVAIDGSTRAYGGLLTALALAQQWHINVQVVSAFDPYYHYVAFNRIAGVLSEEAGKVFRFQEQEKLHEEIIDSGLAKIYQGHLDVAASIAADYDVQVETILLDGKPHAAIEKHLRQVNPSLLIIGKTGIHADPELDIGGNTEHLLHNVDCNVLISQREYQPRIDMLADASTSWTTQAEARMENVPFFVRNMARMAILRYAQERGHTVITESIVVKATAELMPGHAEQAMEEIVAAHDRGELERKPAAVGPMPWSDEAQALLDNIPDAPVRHNIQSRAQKKARTEKSEAVLPEHVATFLKIPVSGADNPPYWHAAAYARLARVPEGFMRDSSRNRIEDYAREHGIADITLEVAEQGLAVARQAMEATLQQEAPAVSTTTSKCPFARAMGTTTEALQSHAPPTGTGASWNSAAENRIHSVPAGFCRDMTRKAAETIAAQQGISEISADFIDQVMQTFEAGAKQAEATMPWEPDARARIARAPEMVRGMLASEIEGWAKRHNMDQVNSIAVDAVKAEWQQRGVFHLDPNDPRNQ